MQIKVRPEVQIGVPNAQRYKEHRDGTLPEFTPMRNPGQMWMCPSCDAIHSNVPITLNLYRCECGWNGDRNVLLRAETGPKEGG